MKDVIIIFCIFPWNHKTRFGSAGYLSKALGGILLQWDLVAPMNCFMWCRMTWLWLLVVRACSCSFRPGQLRDISSQCQATVAAGGRFLCVLKAAINTMSVLCNHITCDKTAVKKATLDVSTVSGSFILETLLSWSFINIISENLSCHLPSSCESKLKESCLILKQSECSIIEEQYKF